MRKLYLHVGVHRTGTTSTQRSLRENFSGLLQRGYLYPYGSDRHDEHVRRVRSGLLTAESWAADLERRADSHPVDVHSVLLSDEDMSLIRDFRPFEALSHRFQVKVVVMLRRQDLWLESWYLQNVKWQWNKRLANLSFEEFIARRSEFHWIDYAARLSHYDEVFGMDSVLPGVFEHEDMPGGPTATVLRLIGIADPSFIGPELHKNSSLSPRTSEFIRHLPLHQLRDVDRRLFELAAQQVDDSLPKGGSKLLLDHALRAEIMAEHAEGNRAVANHYFGREHLFRDPLPAVDAPLADRVLPADPQRLMAEFVVPMLMAVGGQVTSQREKMEQLQQALDSVRRHACEGSQIRLVPKRA